MDFNTESLTEKCGKKDRKPVPEGMTIEQLVETMEENEDMIECAGCEELFPKDECFHKEGIGWLCGNCEDRIVKCTWCDELYDKGECRYEVDLGWLCDRCEMAIKSRGETLTFREGNYWDFLDEDISLTEGAYDFPYFSMESTDKRTGLTVEEVKEAKNKIAEILSEKGYYRTGKLAVPVKTHFHNKITITDFMIAGEKIEVVLEDAYFDGRGNMTNSRTYTWDLKRAYSEVKGLKDGMMKTTIRFLDTLKAAATSVHDSDSVKAAHAIGIKRRRDNSVFTKLTQEIANEFKEHIINIRYTIPLGIYSDVDLEGEDVEHAEKAADNLNKIHDDFFALPFAEAAEAAGMVVDRPLVNKAGEPADTNYYIATQWRAEGRITLDCTVRHLSFEAQAVIESAKVSGSFDNIKDKTEIDCYRLANALIKFFKNDVRFFDTPVESAEVTEAVEPTKFNYRDTVDLVYKDLTTVVPGEKRAEDDWDEEEVTKDVTLTVSKGDVATYIWDTCMTEEDIKGSPYSLEDLEDNDLWDKFLDTNFDKLFEKYYNQILDFYREEAEDQFVDGSDDYWMFDAEEDHWFDGRD